MGIHSELEALGTALMVRRTKLLYLAIALLLFGGLGSVLQMVSSTKQADVATNNSTTIAPALSDACKTYNFYKDHIEACGAADQITADPTKATTVPNQSSALTSIIVP
jgi:hypothetical protein